MFLLGFALIWWYDPSLISNCIHTVDSSALSGQAGQESRNAFSEEANPSICSYQDFIKRDKFSPLENLSSIVCLKRFIIPSWMSDFPEVGSAERKQFKTFEKNGTRLTWVDLSTTFYFTCMTDWRLLPLRLPSLADHMISALRCFETGVGQEALWNRANTWVRK
jgi:hypothetical protein